MLCSVKELYPNDFAWRTEPYEFVSDRLAVDLLYGNPTLREEIESDTLSLNDLASDWEEETKQHREVVTEDNVADVISMMTGIPVNKIAQTEINKLSNNQSNLAK